jgi:uncharacterized membrane protein
MPLAANELITVDGLPAHPLVVHSVVVLLPLAALGAVLISLRSSWRQRYGWLVLVLTVVGVGAVPVATTTGKQLKAALGVDSDVIQRHEMLGDQLLSYALAFGLTVVVLLVAGRLADRERAAAGGANKATSVSKTWRRIAVVFSILVIAGAAFTTTQVIRIGHSGATAVWEGVGQVTR